MRQKIKLLMCLCLALVAAINLSAQSDSIDIHMAVLTAGDSEFSVNGSFSYSIGQVAQEYVGDATKTTKMNQGIQQPHEFLVSVATEELTPGMTELQIYPNPASTEVTIAISQEAMTPFSTYRLTLVNTSGQVLHSEVISSPVTKIPVANLTPGLYILRVVDNAENYAVFKIIKI